MTCEQAKRWFEPSERNAATTANVTDADILANPYRISETDLGSWNDTPVSVGMIDRGLLPDTTISADHPLPLPTALTSANDQRRIRAAIVQVLRRASIDGDALLSVDETVRNVAKLDLARTCIIGADWPATNREALSGVVDVVEVSTGQSLASTPALQLAEIKTREDRLRRILSSRASKVIAPSKPIGNGYSSTRLRRWSKVRSWQHATPTSDYRAGNRA